MPFYKYRTDYNNTIIAISDTSFILGINEAQINSVTTIPIIQPPYLYRVSGSSVIENPDNFISTWLNDQGMETTAPFYVQDFNAYTASTINVTSANNGISKIGNNTRLGGSLTGHTIIIGSNLSRLSFAGWPIHYSTDLSANYGVRSLVDRGYVTGITSTLQTKASIVVLTGTTLPLTYVAKSVFATFTGSTALQSANNGLTKSGTNVRLGGTLTGTTLINTTSFALTNTGTTGLYYVGRTTGSITLQSRNTINLIGRSAANVDRINLKVSATGATFTDARTGTTSVGLQYAANYNTNFGSRSIIDKGWATGYTQVYKYNAGLAPTFITATKTFIASGITDSSGVVTIQVTTNGLAGGTSIFTRPYSIQATAANNTSSTSVIPLASIKDFSNLKTLTVNVEQSNTVLLGGQGLTFAPAGIVVYVTIIGI